MAWTVVSKRGHGQDCPCHWHETRTRLSVLQVAWTVVSKRSVGVHADEART
ncbi:MAG: hypothetical protein NZ556_07185 [Fimbriimonadales bacterium]|nr:hypothetical protein [Fimbriimonadales bacterium]